MTKETEEKLVDYITKHYNPKHGGCTEMWSEGNSTDVFFDGQNRGIAVVLADIASIIGLEVSPLSEQEYDF